MKDIDSMPIEQIIKLPFFHSLEKDFPNAKSLNTDKWWKIIFKCNKFTNNGEWMLLDQICESEYIIRYKLIEFDTK